MKTTLITMTIIGAVFIPLAMSIDEEPAAAISKQVEVTVNIKPEVSVVEVVKKEPFRKLLDAIRIVETGGEPNKGRDSLGDSGASYGPYQIQRAYFQDAQEFNKSLSGYSYEDVNKEEVARQVIRCYWKRYCTKKRLGREPTDADRARMHNGGLNGHRKQSTIKYWHKVRREMNRE